MCLCQNLFWIMSFEVLLLTAWRFFRFPVDLERYKDYNQVIDVPMDLSTIREELSAGGYSTPLDFAKDVRLVFANSKNYNTNNKSRVCDLLFVGADYLFSLIFVFIFIFLFSHSHSLPVCKNSFWIRLERFEFNIVVAMLYGSSVSLFRIACIALLKLG